MDFFRSKIILVLILSIAHFAFACKDNGTNPPSAVEFEITDVEVIPNPVISGDSLEFVVFSDENIDSSYKFFWKLILERDSIIDTVTSSNSIRLIAPSDSGKYEYQVWIESESGEQVSNSFDFSVIVESNQDSEMNFSGKIVFSAKDETGTFQIFRINVNSSNFQQLTFFDIGEDATQPSWSPDGEKIVFSSNKYGISTGPALWTMNSNGSNQEVLYDSEPKNDDVPPLIGEYPHWSSNGEKVLFQLCTNCQFTSNYTIYVFDTITKEVVEVVGHQATDIDPYWSPDGSQISYISDREYRESSSDDYYSDLYISINDTTGEKLTNNRNVRFPIWNPVKQEIAFLSIDSPKGIFKINLETKEINPVRENSSDRVLITPHAWSSDGEKILLIKLELDSPRNHGLYIFDTKRDSLYSIYSQIAPIGNPGLNGADWFSQ